MTKKMRHFFDFTSIDTGALHQIVDTALEWKSNGAPRLLEGKRLAAVFAQPSTRTRISFDLAMRDLGGETIVIEEQSSQMGRGETFVDTGRLLSRYVDIIVLRAKTHGDVLDIARHASVPVINGLTDRCHPCQLIADIMTFREHKGPIVGKTIAWVGDGNNVAHSWIEAAKAFAFHLRLACPQSLAPDRDVMAAAGHWVSLSDDPKQAVVGADAVVTDTWVSMGDEGEDKRRSLLQPYQVNDDLMALARDAIFMHCLPAHRGHEVTHSVFDSPASVVWDEAENRLHGQKGVLAWCLGVI